MEYAWNMHGICMEFCPDYVGTTNFRHCSLMSFVSYLEHRFCISFVTGLVNLQVYYFYFSDFVLYSKIKLD
jgi:hypothetical protein